MAKPKVTSPCVHADLYAVVKAQGKAEGMPVKDWIERALTHELARARKEQAPVETDLSD